MWSNKKKFASFFRGHKATYVKWTVKIVSNIPLLFRAKNGFRIDFGVFRVSPWFVTCKTPKYLIFSEFWKYFICSPHRGWDLWYSLLSSVHPVKISKYIHRNFLKLGTKLNLQCDESDIFGYCRKVWIWPFD